jgi:hypothetical protein
VAARRVHRHPGRRTSSSRTRSPGESRRQPPFRPRGTLAVPLNDPATPASRPAESPGRTADGSRSRRLAPLSPSTAAVLPARPHGGTPADSGGSGHASGADATAGTRHPRPAGGGAHDLGSDFRDIEGGGFPEESAKERIRLVTGTDLGRRESSAFGLVRRENNKASIADRLQVPLR